MVPLIYLLKYPNYINVISIFLIRFEDIPSMIKKKIHMKLVEILDTIRVKLLKTHIYSSYSKYRQHGDNKI